MRRAGLLILGVAIVALSGCSSNKAGDPTGTSGLSAEQVQVQTAIAAAPEIANDGLFDSGAPAGFSSRPGAGTLSGGLEDGGPETNPSIPSTERHWWRAITNVTHSFEYEFTERDSAGRPLAAHVTVHKHITGVFHIAWTEIVPSSTGSDSLVPHQEEKPLADHWVRQLWFARVRTDGGHPREWRLVAASGVTVTSETGDEGVQPVIQSVRVQAGEQDSTFTDPAAAIHWHQLWCVPAGTPVTVTVTTTAPDDIVVLMHHDNRLLLTANGDNTYTGTWNAPAIMGLKHFGVNALSHATLFDPTGGYHSAAWLFPYLNRGEAYGD